MRHYHLMARLRGCKTPQQLNTFYSLGAATTDLDNMLQVGSVYDDLWIEKDDDTLCDEDREVLREMSREGR